MRSWESLLINWLTACTTRRICYGSTDCRLHSSTVTKNNWRFLLSYSFLLLSSMQSHLLFCLGFRRRPPPRGELKTSNSPQCGQARATGTPCTDQIVINNPLTESACWKRYHSEYMRSTEMENCLSFSGGDEWKNVNEWIHLLRLVSQKTAINTGCRKGGTCACAPPPSFFLNRGAYIDRPNSRRMILSASQCKRIVSCFQAEDNNVAADVAVLHLKTAPHFHESFIRTWVHISHRKDLPDPFGGDAQNKRTILIF